MSGHWHILLWCYYKFPKCIAISELWWAFESFTSFFLIKPYIEETVFHRKQGRTQVKLLRFRRFSYCSVKPYTLYQNCVVTLKEIWGCLSFTYIPLFQWKNVQISVNLLKHTQNPIEFFCLTRHYRCRI